MSRGSNLVSFSPRIAADTGLIKYWERENNVYTDEITKVNKRLKRGR